MAFSENLKYWRESLLEVIRQTIARWCQKKFFIQKFVDNAQQCFASTPQANFPAHNLNLHWRWKWWDWIQIPFKIFSTLLTGIGGWIHCKNDGMSTGGWWASKVYLRIRQGPLDRWQGWNTMEWLIWFQHWDVEIGARKTFHSVGSWHRTDLKNIKKTHFIIYDIFSRR